MPHIHDKPGQIDHTVTAFIARLDAVEPRLLFHMHKKFHRLLPVGGHIELDETPWAAVTHEIIEESGYEMDQLEVMQPRLRIEDEFGVVHHPQPLRLNTHYVGDEHYHTDIAYLFVTKGGPARSLEARESTDLRWLTRRQLLGLTADEVYSDARDAAIAIIDKFLADWEPFPTRRFSTDKDPR